MKNKKIFVFIALFAIVCNVQGDILNVGSTDLYTNIVDALNAADDYDVLQLAPETFSGLGNHQIDLSNKSITIAGNSTLSTIIDCQNLGRAFFSLSNASINLVFQDLTIQNCNANGPNSNTSASTVNLTAIAGWGGALALISNFTTLQFINVHFISNYASQGGSLYIMSNQSVIIDNCYFFGNNATQGAGLYFVKTPSVSVADSQLINNCANQTGAALWAARTTFTFSNTDFINNMASQGSGGGSYFQENCQVVFQSSNFLNNTANNNGGAFQLNSGSDADVHDCLFDRNQAGQGGAVSVTNYGTLDSFDSNFTNNMALAWGGAVYIQQAEGRFYHNFVQYNYAQQGGGACSAWNEAEVAIVDSNFTDNSSPRGGAFFLQYTSTLQVTNSNIEYNTADENGGGIYCSDSTLYLNESTILDHNQASSDDSTEIYCAEDIPYTYCKVYGVTNFTDFCSMPEESGPGTDAYKTFIIVGSLLIGGSFLVACGSFIIYFLDASHRKQQGFYFSAFKEEEDTNDDVPLPE